jgi:hypothetical protein
MLVTEIIEDLGLPGPDELYIATDGVVVCVSESGVHRFPKEDVQVVPEVVEHEIMMMALALAE